MEINFQELANRAPVNKLERKNRQEKFHILSNIVDLCRRKTELYERYYKYPWVKGENTEVQPGHEIPVTITRRLPTTKELKKCRAEYYFTVTINNGDIVLNFPRFLKQDLDNFKITAGSGILEDDKSFDGTGVDCSLELAKNFQTLIFGVRGYSDSL